MKRLLLIGLIISGSAFADGEYEYYQVPDYTSAYPNSVQTELRESNRIAREQQIDNEQRYWLDRQDQRSREVERVFGGEAFGYE
jgi:hypothetical protein